MDASGKETGGRRHAALAGPPPDAAALGRFARLVRLPEAQLDLGEAAIAIAELAYHDLDVPRWLRRLDALAARVRVHQRGSTDVLATLAALNEGLFHDTGLRGNADDYADPRNSFLNEVLERNLGIPISLSVVYMEVARRVGLEVHGVSFPGHFVVMVPYEDGVIVLDPFFAGVTLDEEQLADRLRRVLGDEVPAEDYVQQVLVPAGKHEILVRMLRNLKGVYVGRGALERALAVAERILLLCPDDADEVRDRGELYRQLDCFRPALADLQRYLVLSPGARDSETIRARITELRTAVSHLS